MGEGHTFDEALFVALQKRRESGYGPDDQARVEDHWVEIKKYPGGEQLWHYVKLETRVR